MTSDEILYELFLAGQITLEDYMKTQELPSEAIGRINKAIKEHETD
jgi:hypothetical protein